MDTGLQDRIARGATGRPEAADADPAARPGVPMIKPAGSSAELVRPPLDRQRAEVEVLVGVDVGRLTPVFGTCQPPRGLSGVLRRAGYALPEHEAGRWMILLLADRVDVWESRLRRHPVLGALALAAVVRGLSGLRGGGRRRSRARRRLGRVR
jgi:hypothetical protein